MFHPNQFCDPHANYDFHLRQNVFERFYKVDKSRSTNKESTGLGLYIVKTIIKNHGGVISVSSVENQFTAFEFAFHPAKMPYKPDYYLLVRHD